jgi:cyclophilin family peptidyl-prolyl cis-trans isomerase
MSALYQAKTEASASKDRETLLKRLTPPEDVHSEKKRRRTTASMADDGKNSNSSKRLTIMRKWEILQEYTLLKNAGSKFPAQAIDSICNMCCQHLPSFP